VSRVERHELDELLGAYALDAVDDEERRAVERYLADEPRALAEVQQHREVATLLAYSGATAPDGVWARISGSLDDRVPVPGPELAAVLPMTRRRAWAGRLLPALAAAAAAAVFAVVAVRATDGGGGDPIEDAVAAARADRDSVIAALVGPDGVTIDAVLDQDGHGYLVAEALPSLPADRTYQLWGVIDGAVISLGVLGHNPETEMFSAADGLSALVLTEEAAGGVVSSENPALYVGEVG
jgi:anti-sigma-K factor RskA